MTCFKQFLGLRYPGGRCQEGDSLLGRPYTRNESMF